MTLAVGDRVSMLAGEGGWLGVPLPDLGPGTVVATTEEENPYLMVGLYVEVEWDQGWGGSTRYPSAQSLRRLDQDPPGRSPGAARSG